jgi:hypothetical protein
LASTSLRDCGPAPSGIGTASAIAAFSEVMETSFLIGTTFFQESRWKMFGFLANFLPANGRRSHAPPRRRVQLSVEVLEGRALPSVSPILSAAGPLAQTAAVYQVSVVQVANIQGYSFNLISSSGKPAHTLVIQTETFLSDGSATFTGTWQGSGPNAGTPKQIMNGTLKFDAMGNMKLSFSWMNGSGGQNSFLGTLTRVNTSPPAAAYLYPTYHLDGDVTTSVPGDGPGHVSGNGTPPPLVFKM